MKNYWIMIRDIAVITCISLLYRLFISLIIQTTFVPDEYFQYMEVAYASTFGKGILTWEWLPQYRIRSHVFLQPLIWLYKIIITKDISPTWISKLPRFLQAVFSAIGDVAYFCLARNIFIERKVSFLAYFVNLFSWSLSYTMSRSLSNTTETTLLTIGITIFSFISQNTCHVNNRIFLFMGLGTFISFSFYCRPSSVLFWIPILIYSIIFNIFKLRDFIIISLVMVWVIFLFLTVDSLIYGEFVNPILNFYQINISMKYASLYGTHPFHWNFSQGLPVMLGLYLPIVLFGFYRLACTNSSSLLRIIVVSSLFYAFALNVLSPHQEFRFLMPCLPGLHLLVAYTMFWEINYKIDKTLSHMTKTSISRNMMMMMTTMKVMAIISVFILHIIVVTYLLIRHQAGSESILFVSEFLHQRKLFTNNQIMNIFQLGPCHSFPGYSYFHSNTYDIRIYYPDCSPQFKKQNNTESMRFESNPKSFYRDRLKHVLIDESDICPNLSWNSNPITIPTVAVSSIDPHIVITFDSYSDLIHELIGDGYVEVKRFRHTDFRYDYDDPNVKYNVVVLFHPTIL